MLDLALVRRPPPIQCAPAPRWLLAVTLALSVAVHVAGGWLVAVVFRPPHVDLELTVPIDLELGTSEAVEAEPPPASTTATPPTAAAAARHGEGAPLDGGALDAGLADAGPDDGGATDDARVAAVRRDNAGPREAHHADVGTAGRRLPPGAQIALRVDMERIRRSPIAADVRELLAAIPDWKALLDGSGIDPLAQLDRLMIATPNLQREKIVIAGRYRGGETVVREAVARLAEARGQPAPFRVEGGLPIAPWASADATPRVIALIGPRHFTISRVADLPRVLALAADRRRRAPRARAVAAAQSAAEALLAMDEDEGLSLEVEGATQFFRRGRRVLPDGVHLSALERPSARIALRGTFTYADLAEAQEGSAYLTDLKDAYAHNPLVTLLGLGDPLDDARITQEGRTVQLALELSASQARLILGYVRELFRPAAGRP